MSEVYTCFQCGGEVIFRGDPPQKYHLGTGWDCWKSLGGGATSAGTSFSNGSSNARP